MARCLRFVRGDRGQSFVEFALVLPLLVLLIVAIADFGVAYQRYVQLTNATREGARYGSVFPLRTDSSANADPENIKFRVKAEAGAVAPTDAQIAIYYLEANANPPPAHDASQAGAAAYAVTGNGVQVQASVSYTPFSPFANVIFPGGTVRLSAMSVMRIE